MVTGNVSLTPSLPMVPTPYPAGYLHLPLQLPPRLPIPLALPPPLPRHLPPYPNPTTSRVVPCQAGTMMGLTNNLTTMGVDDAQIYMSPVRCRMGTGRYNGRMQGVPAA